MRNEFDGVVIEKQQVLCDAVNCHNLSIKGIGEFRSEVEADFVDISGEACFESYITCDKMTVRNRCVCKSSLLTTSLRIIGVMAVYGKLNSENVIVHGALKFRGNLRAYSFLVRQGSLAKGSAKLKTSNCVINGVLNNSGEVIANEFKICSNKMSRIQEIRTDKFSVKLNPDCEKPDDEFLLSCDFVDCFEAELEYCNIDKLYCDSAIIRKGCTIHEILYRDSIEIEPGAHVERLSRT